MKKKQKIKNEMMDRNENLELSNRKKIVKK